MTLDNKTKTLLQLEAALICHQIGGEFKPLKAKFHDKIAAYELYQPWGKHRLIMVTLLNGKAYALKSLVEQLDELYNNEFEGFPAHKHLNSLIGVSV